MRHKWNYCGSNDVLCSFLHPIKIYPVQNRLLLKKHTLYRVLCASVPCPEFDRQAYRRRSAARIMASSAPMPRMAKYCRMIETIGMQSQKRNPNSKFSAEHICQI